MVQTAPMSMPNDNTTTEPNRIPTAHPEQRADPARPLRVGLDIGSTTVKAVVLGESDALSEPLFADYRRHHANVRATMEGLLKDIRATLTTLGRADEPIALAITGSGGLALADLDAWGDAQALGADVEIAAEVAHIALTCPDEYLLGVAAARLAVAEAAEDLYGQHDRHPGGHRVTLRPRN